MKANNTFSILMSLCSPRFLGIILGFFLVLASAGFVAFVSSTARSLDRDAEKKEAFVRLFTEEKSDYYGGVMTRTLAADQSVWLNASRAGDVKVDIYRTDEDALFRALSYKKKEKDDAGSRGSLATTPFSVDKKNMHRLSETQTFSVNGTDGRTRVTLPVKEPGIYYVLASQGAVSGDAFFVVSNRATQVKEADQELVAWTVDTRTGRHVSEGSVEVYSLSGDPDKTHDAPIGQDGVARVAFDEKDDVLLVRSGGEVTMTPLNFVDHSDRWFVNDWQSFAPTETTTRSFMFTDRPLYQPGDTVLFKSIVRDDHDAVYGVTDGTVRVKLYRGSAWNNEEDKVFEQIIQLSDEGSLDGSFRLPAALETGEYSLSVESTSVSKNPDRYDYFHGRAIYGTAWIEVQYYRKPEYGIDIEVEKDRLIAGDTLRAVVSGNYFSGQPLDGETLNYAVYSSSYYDSPYDSETEDDSFDSGYRYGSWGGVPVSSGTITLDADGKAVIETVTTPVDRDDADRYGMYGSRRDTLPRVYSVSVSVDGDDQHAVFENKNALVMPGDFSLRRKGYGEIVKQGEKMSLPLVLKNNPGASANVADREIMVKTHLTRWVRNDNGVDEKKPWQWSYRKEEQDFDLMYARTDQNGEAVIDFVPPIDGSYEFLLTTHDDRGNELRRTLYAWVSDSSGWYYRGSESDETKLLTLQVEEKKYRPGDTVEVSVSSLVPNREVWLTFERDHVRRYTSVFVEGTSATVRLPLEENDVPDVYLSGTVFDATGISTDQVAIDMDDASKEMNLDIRTDKERYEPGETVSVEVSAKDFRNQPMSGEVTLWAVDKALFELMESNSGDIFDTFWFRRYHDTQWAYSLQGLTYTINMAEGGGCFSGDTTVLMEDGSSRAIRDVRVGDRVLTRRSENDDTLVAVPVLSTHEIQENGYLLVNGTIRVTPAHRLFVNNGWKAAGDMVIGDVLTGPDGSDIPVQSLEWRHEEITVYNLTIEGAHSFFAGGILAHNDIGGKDGGARSKFVDTAYWNPRLQLGSDGKAKVTFKLPDNTTTWVISAVGADTLTRVGQTKQEITVSKDVIVRTVLPNEMRVGDSVVVSSMVHNNTDQPLDMEISSLFSAGSIEDGSDRTVSVGAHGVEKITFKVRPEKAEEEATFTVKALPKRDGESAVSGDVLVSKLPVVEYGFAQDAFQSAVEPTTLSLRWNKNDDTAKRHVTLDISSDLFGTLPSAMKYLLDYPYGCVEQTTSRFVPLVIARQYPNELGEALKNVESSKMIAEGIRNLYKLQNSDGSFGFWHDGEGNPFITAYVAEYVLVAKPFGIETELTDSMLGKLRTYVKEKSEIVKGKLASGEKQSEEGWRTAYYEGEMISLAYAKSMLGLPVDRSETHPGGVLGRYENLPPDILALAVLTNVQQGDLDSESNGSRALLAMAHQDNSGRLSWEGGRWTQYYASSQASTALAIRALVASRVDHGTIAQAVKTLNVNRNANYWGNTFATAQIIRALADFHRLGSVDAAPDYAYKVLVDGKEVASGSMKGVHGRKTIELGAEYFSQPKASIQIIREGAGDIYSTLSQNAFSVDKEFPGTTGNFTVKRSYQNLREDGAPIAVGDKVMVTIEATASEASLLNGDRMVIDDVLPAGLVPVNDSFKNEQEATRIQIPRGYAYLGFSVDQYKRNGVVLTADTEDGSHYYRATYTARAVNAGKYAVPPASAALMYSPEYNAYSAADTVVITEEKRRAPIPGQVSEDSNQNKLMKGLVAAVGILILSVGAIVWRHRHQSRKAGDSDGVSKSNDQHDA